MRFTYSTIRLLAPLLVAAPVWAQGNVTVFGVLDTYIDHSTAGSASATRVQSGGISGSRLGFRGSEDLGSGNRAIFLLESGINVDDGSSGQGGILFGRQAWVGLSTRAGELTVGRQYAPYFFTLITYALGGGMGWGNASTYFTDNSPLRVNNSISYTSPLMSGFKLRALYGLGENTSQPGGSNVGNIHSASIQYDQGKFSANVAYETRKTTARNTDRFYVAGASYDFGFAKMGLLAQARRDDIDASANNAVEISVQMPVGAGYLLFDAGRFVNRSVVDADALATSIRYDHYLSKRTMLYAGMARMRNDAMAKFGINGNTGSALAVAKGDDPRSIILGMRHTF